MKKIVLMLPLYGALALGGCVAVPHDAPATYYQPQATVAQPSIYETPEPAFVAPATVYVPPPPIVVRPPPLFRPSIILRPSHHVRPRYHGRPQHRPRPPVIRPLRPKPSFGGGVHGGNGIPSGANFGVQRPRLTSAFGGGVQGGNRGGFGNP